ncbi:MAG: hydroxymethylglutaryl-CoA lyase [Chthoniobacterales bacterium]|nr:hydroxymethylglutaryl-CoA lyase [Chthoniobacterales bacterium]
MIQPASQKEQPVKLIECPRDAWQGLPGQIPTERKVEYLRALIEAGFRHLDAASFVSPKAVPQMADSAAVLAQLKLPNDAEIIGIVVNETGAERALATNVVTTLGYPFSISETFLRRNQNQSPNENTEILRRIKARAETAGREIVVYISMAFGNPYGDPWSEERVTEAAREIASLGLGAISLADTAGVATTEQIRRVVRAVSNLGERCEIGVHLHGRREEAAPKVLAAYDAGCRRFDSALGGLGGCPFAQDELVGNIPTEEVLRALASRGVPQPVAIDLENVLRLNREISAAFAA